MKIRWKGVAWSKLAQDRGKLWAVVNKIMNIYVLLTVHLSIFISVIKPTWCTKCLFHNKIISCSKCFEHMCWYHQEVKIALHSLWYHHTYSFWYHHTYRCDDTRCCVMQFWPLDDQHMCSKHVEAWNKLIVKQKICASSWLITNIKIMNVRVP